MYPGKTARSHPDRAAVIMAGTGETISYGELEARSNRLAHLLRARGLRRLDHYSIYMENHPRYVEACAAGGYRQMIGYIDAENALDPVYAGKLGVNVPDLLISQPDTGEQALEIADMLHERAARGDQQRRR
mgnify:CR=1 FL=1